VKLNGPRHGELSSSLSLVLGEAVDMALTTRNHGKTVATVSAALHSYIAVGDLRQVALSGLENASSHDKLTDTHGTLPASPWRFDGPTDAVVASGAACTLHDAAWQRKVAISSSGSASTVVWTPWASGAAALADMPDDGWQHFLCVEAANAGADSRQIAPGDSHTLGQHLHLTGV
jgi:glucose-6-phosphate 1-epimerase